MHRPDLDGSINPRVEADRGYDVEGLYAIGMAARQGIVVVVLLSAESGQAREIDRLNMLTAASPHLPFPHSSQIEGELRELRCHFGRELYRILYRRSRNLIVLLHIFRKDTGSVPEAEIQVAKERWNDFRTRMDAPRRRPPRAAGRDAP